ncbi:MAG: hypothetical protein KDA51_11140 [Planctomycetales bacterium]|nr:hypothetical protein [Planctomycetales bacterium]
MAERQRRSKWQVHESTARALCQLTFLLCGMLPLGLCLYWSAQQFLPTYQRHQAKLWEQFLTSQLGVSVKVAAYESRAPERFALHEIRLNHPETGASIGRVRMAEVQRSDGKWAIRLSQPELEERELATAWRIAHDWFLCRPQTGSQAARLGMSELTIHTVQGNQRILRDVTTTLLPAAEATLLSIQFRPSAPDASSNSKGTDREYAKPVQCIVKRHHRAEGLKTEMQLRTGSVAVPCGLLADLTPWGGRLGTSATFTGTLDLELRSDSWRAMLTDGRLSNIEFGALTADSEVALSGTGEVNFEQLALSQQGIELASASGGIRNGKMAAGLFHALEKYLGVAVQGTNQVSLYGFDQLDFALHIRQPSLHFVCLMSDAQGLLAARGREQWNTPLPLENVVAALASCSAPSASSAANTGAEDTDAGKLPTTWLSKLALVWLPLGDPQWQAETEREARQTPQTTSGRLARAPATPPRTTP